MQLANPWFLLLIILMPFMVSAVKGLDRVLRSSLRFSDQRFFDGARSSFRTFLSNNIIFLRVVVLILLLLALARPRMPIDEIRVFVEGIDIVLAIDASGSMQAMDFEMGGKRFDRLTVVKNVVQEFVGNRPDDRIGIIAFASAAYTVCPLTLDHDWLEKNIERVKIGMMEDGTAIGSAISASLNRLKDSEVKERIVILLTDGRNNSGSISPLAAAEAARALGVKIYTIGAGTKGLAPFPMKDMFGNAILQPVEIDIDEDLLRKIAVITGGKYFRATDTESLLSIYEEIDKLEKTEIEEVGYRKYNEFFNLFLLPALFVLLFEVILGRTYLGRLP